MIARDIACIEMQTVLRPAMNDITFTTIDTRYAELSRIEDVARMASADLEAEDAEFTSSS